MVQALFAAYPEAAKAMNKVHRLPPPLAAPRASEATQRVLRGTRGHSELSPHSHSEAPQWPLRRHLSGHSEVLRGEIRGHSKAITRPQRHSEAHQMVFRGNQRQSEAIKATQRHSEVTGTQDGHDDPRLPAPSLVARRRRARARPRLLRHRRAQLPPAVPFAADDPRSAALVL